MRCMVLLKRLSSPRLSMPVLGAGALLALWTASALPAGLDGGPWPMFHRSGAHDGLSPFLMPIIPGLLWSETLSDTVEFSSPVIDHNGNIYLGNLDGEIWAFDSSGDTLWTYESGGNIRRSTPAVADDGTVYFGSNDGKLYALNPDGSFKWARPTGAPVKTSPAIDSNGTIYVGNDGARLWAINPSGGVEWTYPVGDTIRSSPAVVGDSIVVFGSNDGFIYAVRTDGSLHWAAATGGPVKASPAVGQGGAVFVGSYDGFLYSIWHYGNLNWATFIGEELRSSPAIGGTGKIYLGVDTEIHCYRDEGDFSWAFETGGRVFSSPALTPNPEDGDIAICGSDDGKIYAARAPGVEVWSYDIGSPVRSSPGIGLNGRIYVGALDGRLYAFGETASSIDEDLQQLGLRLLIGPNPFPSGTRLAIRVSGAAPVQGSGGMLQIYDPLGRRVRSLRLHTARSTYWDGRDAKGDLLPAGVYFYKWSMGRAGHTGRVVRVR